MRRLEIGCGDLQTEGFEHLDSRDLPGVDHVQDCRDLSNFDDGTFGEIVAKDVIEHLSWWDVPKALAEWLRVLVPGGSLEVETPNALELVDLLLGTPGDATARRWGTESDWQRFSRIAYGHQDYPENFHGCYFTAPWLTQLLLDAGASRVDPLTYDAFRFRLRAVR